MGPSSFVFERFAMSTFKIYLYDCAFAVHAVFAIIFRGRSAFPVEPKYATNPPSSCVIYEFNFGKWMTFESVRPYITLTTGSFSYSNLSNLVHVYNIANFESFVNRQKPKAFASDFLSSFMAVGLTPHLFF